MLEHHRTRFLQSGPFDLDSTGIIGRRLGQVQRERGLRHRVLQRLRRYPPAFMLCRPSAATSRVSGGMVTLASEEVGT